MDYIEVVAEFKDVHPWRDILISVQSDLGYESFVETKTGLKSYIPESSFDEEAINGHFGIEGIEKISFSLIKDRNWNATWEEHFDPVLVEDKVAILAPFHSGDFDVELKLIIQPQMSFGTGHHQTTWMMSKKLMEMNLSDKTILDMGTGTGVLAILAEKRGAKNVFAPDIDEWSFKNAQDNVKLNDCSKIDVALGGIETVVGRSFDVIVANINKNVLVEQFSVYSESLKSGGDLLISGFFETDQPDLVEKAAEYGFIFEEKLTKDEWALLVFKAQ